MTVGIVLGCIAVCVFNIWDLKEHNKKVEKNWPDISDQNHVHNRLTYTVGLGGEYILLVILIGLFIKELLEELT